MFPELALTTFFPRWYFEDQAEIDASSRRRCRRRATKPLFDEAQRLGVGFSLGYAELHRRDGRTATTRRSSSSATARVVATYRKVHIPGHEEHEPWRPFQHLERHYFEPAPDGFGVWRAFGGIVGMAICNDRRWPETYRVLGLQGVELILIGYNTPIHYAPDPSQDALAGFHNHLVMQAGAYQNGTWVVGVAKGGVEEGVDSLAQSRDHRAVGRDRRRRRTTVGDELAVGRCDLDRCARYKETLFDFDRYRMPRALRPDHRAEDARRTAADALTHVHRHELDHVHAQRAPSHRAPPTIRTCSPRCARSSTSPRRRTAARRRASAAAAPCSSTARRSSPARSRSTRVAGKSVTTLEGFDPTERDRYANAFAAHGALQCGFCTPGIVVRTKSLIDKKGADLDRERRGPPPRRAPLPVHRAT